jgi:hypothetical protein
MTGAEWCATAMPGAFLLPGRIDLKRKVLDPAPVGGPANVYLQGNNFSIDIVYLNILAFCGRLI